MFAILAVGAGYWQVVEAQRLSTAPDNPAVIAIARRALRGPIVDRDGRWLARSDRDRNGEAVREYRDDTVSHVVGYASRRYGTTGLERTYNAELIGLVVRRRSAASWASSTRRRTRRSACRRRSTCGCSVPRSAASAADHGAVVMLDPTTGEVLALASTPVYDANGIANPDTAQAVFDDLSTDDDGPAPAAGDARAATCPGRCSRS